MALKSCYMVVTPDPRKQESATYYVKFGDGKGTAAYHRCNPAHGYAQNDQAPSEKLFVVRYDGVKDDKWAGKWLEWILIKVNGGMQIYENTEWHTLQVKSLNDCSALRNRLCAMLDLFPRWNRWEELGCGDQATWDFEELVDTTWSIQDDRAIAQFCS